MRITAWLLALTVLVTGCAASPAAVPAPASSPPNELLVEIHRGGSSPTESYRLTCGATVSGNHPAGAAACAHLARLVTNLVDNAVRHATTVVRIRVHAEDGQAVLHVLDDGPGIPEEQREAVFDRFTRLDEARARDVGGAGLGLPIARDIASLHGGTLFAEEGGFIARFPLNH